MLQALPAALGVSRPGAMTEAARDTSPVEAVMTAGNRQPSLALRPRENQGSSAATPTLVHPAPPNSRVLAIPGVAAAAFSSPDVGRMPQLCAYQAEPKADE